MCAHGSPRHDAAARSARILKANARSITLAEVLTGVLHDAVEGSPASLTAPLLNRVRGAWGSIEERPFPYSEATLAAAADTLTALADRWSGLTPGDELVFTWPAGLTAPVPAARR